MNTLMFLAQVQRNTSASFEAGRAIGSLFGLALLAFMLISAITVIVKWPPDMNGRFAVGFFMLTLPFTGLILGLASRAFDFMLARSALLVIPASWLVWLILFIYCIVVIKQHGRRKREAELDRAPARPRFDQPYSNGPVAPQPVQPEPAFQQPVEPPVNAAPKITADTLVLARCKTCMGRWKSTAGEAKALEACPKCGDSPPQLRLQRA